MSSEVHKYIEEALERKENLFNAKVIDFPNDIKAEVKTNLKTKDQKFWKISDKSNDDQQRAIIGICFMFGSLIIMGLYSNLV
tara:strand:- start:213 stop:458 length:246 start_codon:yes stop_codon:yes gene_type:complete